jgi:hypothetical protein
LGQDSGTTLTVTKLAVFTMDKGKKVTWNNHTKEADTIFDKSSAQISNLVYKTCLVDIHIVKFLIYNNGSKFKLHFHALCNTYGIKHKPTSV